MKLYQSNILNNFSNITHAFTTRDRGMSLSPYDSLNLAFHVGDNPSHVLENHALLAQTLGYEPTKLIHMKQIHSNKVHIVKESDNFENPPTCDALITNRVNTPLMVMVADCSPLLFYDPHKNVIAVAHAGRAGAFGNIVNNVVKAFIDEFESSAINIHVSVGASIGVCCYEVGDEIYEEAENLGFEYAMQKRANSFYLDVNAILERQLLECGINKKHIEFSDDCSACKNETLFSYRKDGVTGRFSGVIFLKG